MAGGPRDESWFELDDAAWRIYGGLHRLLLRVAGRIPDDVLTHARTLLGNGDLARLTDYVSVMSAELGVALTAAEVELLTVTLTTLDAPGGAQPVALAQVSISEVTSATDHTFAPAAPAVLTMAGARLPESLDLTGAPPAGLADITDALTDVRDYLMVDGLSQRRGVIRIWRAWRYGPQGPPMDPKRIYIVEVAQGVRAWELVLSVQRDLIQVDEESPQIEMYWTGDDLPPYQRAARARSALLWASSGS
jgi:hypothetical protein